MERNDGGILGFVVRREQMKILGLVLVAWSPVSGRLQDISNTVTTGE